MAKFGMPGSNCLTAAIRLALYSGAFWAQATEGAAWAVLAYYDSAVTGVNHG